MIRIPTYSLALFVLGMLIGNVLMDESAGWMLGGVGSLVGYAIWLRARLRAFAAGQTFHLGTIINVLICTVFAIGFGVIGLLNPLDNDPGFHDQVNSILFPAILGFSAIVIWIHWRVATNTKFLPTVSEIGRQALATVFAKDLGGGALDAVVEVGKEVVTDARSHFGRG